MLWRRFSKAHFVTKLNPFFLTKSCQSSLSDERWSCFGENKYAIHKFNKCLPCTRFCKSYKEPLFGSLTFFNFCSVLRRASQRNHLLHQISNIKLFDNIRAYYESEPCKVNNVLILSFILMKNSTYFRSDSEHVLYNLRARGFKSNHCRNLSLKKDSKTAVTALSTQLLGFLVKFTFYVI